MLTATLLLALQGLPATPRAQPQSQSQAQAQSTCDQPVLMVVTGTTHDRQRMIDYARAIAASKLYEQLGGYYVNVPAPVASFEGEAEGGHTTLIVRFPCLANAQTFWYSRTYQDEIRPLRLDPSAGDYIVRVYPEAAVRADMAGKVGTNGYLAEFDAEGIEQVKIEQVEIEQVGEQPVED